MIRKLRALEQILEFATAPTIRLHPSGGATITSNLLLNPARSLTPGTLRMSASTTRAAGGISVGAAGRGVSLIKAGPRAHTPRGRR